jgi:hypothetical protein
MFYILPRKTQAFSPLDGRVRKKNPSFFYVMSATVFAALVLVSPARSDQKLSPDVTSLQRTFRENPWSESANVQGARKIAFVAADALIMDFPPAEWREYCSLRLEDDEEKARALKMEATSPLLSFIHHQLSGLAQRLKALPLKDNEFAVAYVYNHGFLVRSGDVLIGIDLAAPMIEEMADFLDVLVVSHWHHDHWNHALLTAMLRRGKTIYAPGYSGSPTEARNRSQGGRITIPEEGVSYQYGAIAIRFHRGDHYPQTYVDFNPKIKVSEKGVLDSIIEIAPPVGPSAVILHDADDFNKQSKLSATGGKSVDIFLGHGVPSPARWKSETGKEAQVWRDLNESIGDPFGTALEMRPRFFIAGHAAERGHENNVGGCTPFKDAVEFCELLSNETQGATRAATLMWGEMLVFSIQPNGEIALVQQQALP